MAIAVNYGGDEPALLDIEADRLVADLRLPAALAIEDVGQSIRAALDAPLDFPPLRMATTRGDRVAIALGWGVPRSFEIVTAVVGYLLDAGVTADGIWLIHARPDAAFDRQAAQSWPAAWQADIRNVIHNPRDRRQLSYLAATSNAEPILLNRALIDADVVLPIGVVRRAGMAGYFGHGTAIFPSLADDRVQARFRAAAARAGDLRKQLLREASEVAWLLGMQLTLQVVPAGGGEALAVLAGQPEAVTTESRRLYDAAWRATASETADVVVATIEGPPQQQTWENLAQAATAAGRLADDGGSLVLCSALAEPPGAGTEAVAAAESPYEAQRWIARHRPADTFAALQLAKQLRRCRVYLLSNLDPTAVAAAGLLPVADPDELARLVAGSESVALLTNAPYAVVRVGAAD